MSVWGGGGGVKVGSIRRGCMGMWVLGVRVRNGLFIKY